MIEGYNRNNVLEDLKSICDQLNIYQLMNLKVQAEKMKYFVDKANRSFREREEGSLYEQ